MSDVDPAKKVHESRDVSAEYHMLAACTAASTTGVFALTQLNPMSDWGTTIATYAFAIGLPVSAGGALAAWGDGPKPDRQASAVTSTTIFAGLVTLTGLTALFSHFHPAAAVCFLIASIATFAFWWVKS